MTGLFLDTLTLRRNRTPILLFVLRLLPLVEYLVSQWRRSGSFSSNSRFRLITH